MKKSLQIILIACLAQLSILTAFGQQSIYLGLKGGLSFPNLSSGSNSQYPLANGYKSMTGGDFGLVSIFRINDWFAIQPEVDYSQQGGTHKGLQAFPDPNPQGPPYLYANFKNVANLNYLLIPIMARFDFSLGNKLKLFVNAGGFAGFLLSAKQVGSGSSNIYAYPDGTQQVSQSPQSFNSSTDIKKDEHKANVGVIGAVGLSYPIPGGKVFIDGGFNYGFTRIQKSSANGTNYTGAATMHIGYLVAIK